MRPILVLFPFLAYLSTAAFAAVPVSDTAISAAARTRSSPAIAAGDDGYLAVWTDHRSGEPQIVAARLDSAGNVLDPTGLIVAGRGFSPDVEWNGESYLVSYACGELYRPAVCAATVTADGGVRGVDANPIAAGFDPALAWNGANYLLAAWTSNIDSRITLVLLDRNGAPVKQPITVGEPASTKPRVASKGDDFYLVWKVPFGIMGQVISRDGGPVASPAYVAGPGERHFDPDIASDGTDYYAVWDHVVVAPIVQMNVEGRAIAANGQFKSDARVVAYGHSAAWMPAVAFRRGLSGFLHVRRGRSRIFFRPRRRRGASWSSRRALVTWTDWNGLMVSRVLQSGLVARRSKSLVVNPRGYLQRPSAAWNGSEYVIAWTRTFVMEADVVFVRVSPDLLSTDQSPLPLRVTDDRELSPALTFDGEMVVAVYQRFASESPWGGAGRIFAKRLPRPRSRAVRG